MRLVTQRLLLRPFTIDDVIDAHEIFSNEEVMRFCEPAYDIIETTKLVELFAHEGTAFAAQERLSGKVIGHLLFKQLPGEEAGIYEIGWFINQKFWRRGFAFEACKALINYGFKTLDLHKICAETIDSNKSVKLIEKLGMRKEGVFRLHTLDNAGDWADLYWYAILKADWLAQKKTVDG